MSSSCANLSFQIFNKTGTSLFGPAANNTLWAGFGGPCQTSNSGDPVVLYDQLADRWILSQFTAGSAPFLNCVAISQTSDPTGAYFRYAFHDRNDWGKFSRLSEIRHLAGCLLHQHSRVPWQRRPIPGCRGLCAESRPNARRQSHSAGDLFPHAARRHALQWLATDCCRPIWMARRFRRRAVPNTFLARMDNNGPYGAPSGCAESLSSSTSISPSPANSTFALANTIPTAPFNSILGLCGGTRACIPQPGTANRIDHLGYRQRPLHRLAYRNFGTHESLVTNQSVSAGNGANGRGVWHPLVGIAQPQ